MPLRMERIRTIGLGAGAVVLLGGVAVGSWAGIGDPPRVTPEDCAAAHTVGDVLAMAGRPGATCTALRLGEVAFHDPAGVAGNSFDASDPTGTIQVRVAANVRPTRNPSAGFVCHETELALIDGGYWLAHCQLTGATPTPTALPATAAPTPRPTKPSVAEPAYYDIRQVAQTQFETSHLGQTVPINGVTLKLGTASNAWLVDGTSGVYVMSGNNLPNPTDPRAPTTITCGTGSRVQVPQVPGHDPTMVHCER